MPMGGYYIPPSLRSRPGINQILKYYQYHRETENEYKSYLEKEVAFKSKYQAEFSKFIREYKPEKPLNQSHVRTDLYRALHERQSCLNYLEAVYEFYFLFRLSEEYDFLEMQHKNQNQLKMRGNQTYHGNNVASGLHTMKPGQVLYDSKQSSLGGSSQPVTSTEQPLVVNGQRYILENMYRELKNRATIQENDIKDFQKEVREKDKYIDDLRNRLSGFASKALTEGNPDFTDLSYKNRPTRIAEAFHNVYDDEWTTALKALTHSKKGSSTPSEEDAIISLMKILQAKKGVDNTETTASEQTDINIAISPNRFAQCPIVDGQWSSEKDAELLSLQEQNKSYAESMVTMLKAKRIKEDENSKLKTRVQQLERDFQKKAKEVDSLKIVKQTLEERLNKQSKE